MACPFLLTLGKVANFSVLYPFLKNARTCSNLQHFNKVNNQRAEKRREKGAFGVSSENRSMTFVTFVSNKWCY